MNKTDHVVAHGGAVDPVDESTIVESRILSLRERNELSGTKEREREREREEREREMKREIKMNSFNFISHTKIQTKKLLTSTFSTTCLPKEQTFVEQEMVMLSWLSYLTWGTREEENYNHAHINRRLRNVFFTKHLFQ